MCQSVFKLVDGSSLLFDDSARPLRIIVLYWTRVHRKLLRLLRNVVQKERMHRPLILNHMHCPEVYYICTPTHCNLIQLDGAAGI